MVYRDRTDYARQVESFMHDFQTRTGGEIEVINPDTRDGIGFCQAYGIVEYPTIIVLDYNSIVQAMWRGLPLPTINEVSFYN